MMHSATFVKIIVVYGHIDENGHFVRKWSSRKMAITDKCSKNSLLSVNPHHNGQKFTDKSPENVGLSVKCGLITDKSAKIGSLSVNFSEILADCPKNKKYPTIIRLLCLTIIGHFIMARIFIIIQLRTGS